MAWTDNFNRYNTNNGFGNGKKWRESFYERVSDHDVKQILSSQDETPYSLLGINENATQDEIKKSFRLKITEWHPDKNQHREIEATFMSKKIIAAYTLLSKR